MEKVISFRNKFNNKLFGILHEPDRDNLVGGKVGINLLAPGLKNRVAPHRLNVKIARKLCELGYYVLRFDPHGVGDSEGEFMGSNEPIMDLWGAIQKGSFIEDTILANEFLCSYEGISKVILIGQCGAGVTAGIVGGRHEIVDRLILVDTPFRIFSSELELSDVIIENTSTKQLVCEYVNDFIRFDWMTKIFKKGINKAYLKEKVKIFKRAIISRYQRSNNVHERFNYNLSNSLLKFMDNRKKVFFLFSENDSSLSEFNIDFKSKLLQQKYQYEDYYSINIIDQANHIYTEIKFQEKLINNICNALAT